MSERCNLCPRACNADRDGNTGYCGVGNDIVAGAAMLHFWEEPVIADERGSGTVFFSGCSLKCIYCQNFRLSRGEGKVISVARLADIFKELEDKGACNIDLVTASHYVPQIIRAFDIYKPGVPVVYNCGGYEKTETLKMLQGYVDIYLPDFKYSDAQLAKKYSNAPDYPQTARSALEEMKRQIPEPVFGKDGLMKKGIVVRHMVLPQAIGNTRGALDILSEVIDTKKDWLSLMSQYIPFGKASEYPEINRRIKPLEYKAAVTYAQKLGFENILVQECESASEDYVPDFHGQGV